MDQIEIQVFDEIYDYKEKIGIMTFRQWLFSALAVLLVVPTYIVIPKYTFITPDMASYIVILEAGIIGFIGFVKIHNLPAEKIIPYWYRHYLIFGKPIKYMTTKEYQKQQEEKKNKKKKKNSVVNIENNKELTPKQLKSKTKQQKELQKAKKKYGYLFKEDNPISEPNDDEPKKKIVEVMQGNKPISEDEVIIVDVDKEFKELESQMKKNSSSTGSSPIDVFKIKNQHSEEKLDKSTEIEEENSESSSINTSESDELENKLNSLSDEEKRLLLKILGK